MSVWRRLFVLGQWLKRVLCATAFSPLVACASVELPVKDPSNGPGLAGGPSSLLLAVQSEGREAKGDSHQERHLAYQTFEVEDGAYNPVGDHDETVEDFEASEPTGPLTTLVSLTSEQPTGAELDEFGFAPVADGRDGNTIAGRQAVASKRVQRDASDGLSSAIAMSGGSRGSLAAPGNVTVADRGFRQSSYRASSTELALLQRWDASGEGPLGSVAANAPFAGSGGSWVSVESEFSGETFGLPEISPAFGQAGEWEQDTSLSSDLQLSNSARVTLGHSYSGSRSRESENFAAAFVGLSDAWEEDTLNNTAFKVGLWGDRLELTSLHSVSRHGEVTLGDDVVMGQGFFQGLDADLLSGESVSLSVSGSYGIADDAYGSSGGDDDEEGLAGVPGAGTEAMDYGLEAGFALGFADLSLTHEKTWETEDIGEDYQNLVSSDYEVGLGFDSLDFMFSYNQSSETEGRGEDRERQTSVGYAAEAEYEVQALRSLLGDPFGVAFWDYAPTSISASYGIQQSKDSDGGREETTELGVAASWDWDGGYAGLGYSYSFQDDQQVASGDNDYRSEGFDLGGGLYGGGLAFDGGLYVYRSAGLGQWNESVEFGIDPYLSLSYEPDHWPDLSVSGSASYYQGDYISDGGTSMSRSWEVLTEFDFAKFWPEALDSEDERMMLVFHLEGDSSREEWGNDVSGNSSLDYFVGFKVDLTLGE